MSKPLILNRRQLLEAMADDATLSVITDLMAANANPEGYNQYKHGPHVGTLGSKEEAEHFAEKHGATVKEEKNGYGKVIGYGIHAKDESSRIETTKALFSYKKARTTTNAFPPKPGGVPKPNPMPGGKPGQPPPPQPGGPPQAPGQPPAGVPHAGGPPGAAAPPAPGAGIADTVKASVKVLDENEPPKPAPKGPRLGQPGVGKGPPTMQGKGPQQWQEAADGQDVDSGEQGTGPDAGGPAGAGGKGPPAAAAKAPQAQGGGAAGVPADGQAAKKGQVSDDGAEDDGAEGGDAADDAGTDQGEGGGGKEALQGAETDAADQDEEAPAESGDDAGGSQDGMTPPDDDKVTLRGDEIEQAAHQMLAELHAGFSQLIAQHIHDLAGTDGGDDAGMLAEGSEEGGGDGDEQAAGQEAAEGQGKEGQAAGNDGKQPTPMAKQAGVEAEERAGLPADGKGNQQPTVAVPGGPGGPVGAGATGRRPVAVPDQNPASPAKPNDGAQQPVKGNPPPFGVKQPQAGVEPPAVAVAAAKGKPPPAPQFGKKPPVANVLHRCPSCGYEMDEDQWEDEECPNCGEVVNNEQQRDAQGRFGEGDGEPTKGAIGKGLAFLGGLGARVDALAGKIPVLSSIKDAGKRVSSSIHAGLEKRYGPKVANAIMGGGFLGGYGVAAGAAKLLVSVGLPGIPGIVGVNDLVAMSVLAGAAEVGLQARRAWGKLTGNEAMPDVAPAAGYGESVDLNAEREAVCERLAGLVKKQLERHGREIGQCLAKPGCKAEARALKAGLE